MDIIFNILVILIILSIFVELKWSPRLDFTKDNYLIIWINIVKNGYKSRRPLLIHKIDE